MAEDGAYGWSLNETSTVSASNRASTGKRGKPGIQSFHEPGR
jgi:hypothetical protein